MWSAGPNFLGVRPQFVFRPAEYILPKIEFRGGDERKRNRGGTYLITVSILGSENTGVGFDWNLDHDAGSASDREEFARNP